MKRITIQTKNRNTVTITLMTEEQYNVVSPLLQASFHEFAHGVVGVPRIYTMHGLSKDQILDILGYDRGTFDHALPTGWNTMFQELQEPSNANRADYVWYYAPRDCFGKPLNVLTEARDKLLPMILRWLIDGPAEGEGVTVSHISVDHID